MIARLCRAFFMHILKKKSSVLKKKRSDCPVMSGFFHAPIVIVVVFQKPAKWVNLFLFL